MPELPDGEGQHTGALRVGCSGWQYDHWRGDFYPSDLPKSGWFAHYARSFDTVEINNTFYRMPQAHTFEQWREQAPPGFRYAIKFSRFGTHRKKLLDSEQTIPYCLDRAERLEAYLGPILVQLPPGWGANIERLDEFLRNAPRRRRWAVEIRDPSWLNAALYECLERHGAALCVHDMIEDHPWRITTDWAYIRFHGSKHHDGDYGAAELEDVAGRLRAWLARGVDVYAYFNNDVGGHAVRNALDLVNRLSA